MPEIASVAAKAIGEGASLGKEGLHQAHEALGETSLAELQLPADAGLAAELAQASGHQLGEMAQATAIAFEAFEAQTISGTAVGRETIGAAFEGRPELSGLEWGETHWTVDYEHEWNQRDFSGVGDPTGAAECWQQQTESSCAVMSQAGVIEYLTGTRLTEAQATRICRENGWYHPDRGTYPADCAQLLEHQGIPCEMGHDYAITDIAQALAEGEQVIVGLDATSIWYPQRDAITGELVYSPGGRGHAVWITGLDVDAVGNWTVIMNDTGHPGGRMRAVSLEDFLAGWDDFGNFAVITQHGPTGLGGHTELAGQLSGQALEQGAVQLSGSAGELAPVGEAGAAHQTENT